MKQYGDAPATRHYTVTPAATVMSPRPRFLYISADGDVTIKDELDNAVTYTVVAGQVLNFSPTKITAATATVIAWY